MVVRPGDLLENIGVGPLEIRSSNGASPVPVDVQSSLHEANAVERGSEIGVAMAKGSNPNPIIDGGPENLDIGQPAFESSDLSV